MKILVASLSADVVTDVVSYYPLKITDNLQDAIDYVRNNAFSKYLAVEKFAFFTLRDSDKLIAHILDNKIIID